MTATETGALDETPDGVMPPELTPGQRLKAILGGSAGNLVEWFDWSAYLYFAVYFASQFFPKGDQTAQLLNIAAVSAVGFLARPVGAWLMGAYADRAGRRAALTLSVAMMCVGSLVIALTPTYARIGALAPAILVAARVLQGLSVGGEYGASATYLSEMASRRYRGFWSSFQYVTLIAGQLVAIGLLVVLQQLMSEQDLTAWGWRIPFFVGAALAIIVFWIRRGIEETRHFAAAKASGEKLGSPLTLILRHPRQTLMVMGLTAGGSLAYYVYTSYMQKFLVNTSGFSKTTASQIAAASLFCFMLLQPLFGWISDKFGRRPMLAFAYAGGMIATWPLMTAIGDTHDPLLAFGLLMIALVFQSGYSSIAGVFKAEMFPAHVRALGVALPYAIANAVFGGSAEYVALWFKQEGMEGGFYVYASVVLAVGLLVVLILPDPGRNSLIEDD
jgi:MHS family alpha-ketoglutarate permease-like MFS transporter